jgi:hypothetical protein
MSDFILKYILGVVFGFAGYLWFCQVIIAFGRILLCGDRWTRKSIINMFNLMLQLAHVIESYHTTLLGNDCAPSPKEETEDKGRT